MQPPAFDAKKIEHLRSQIAAYKPISEQEEQDQKTILKYIDDVPHNILLRDNVYAHVSSSSWIVNPSRTKVLLIYHNIYKSWTWTGGHADGDDNLLQIALREAEEETGVKCRPLSEEIVCLDVLPVWGHRKNGKWVSSHMHLSVCYMLEADEDAELRIKEDENSGVKWMPNDQVIDACCDNEPEMRYVYEKLMKRIADFPPSK